MNIQEKITTLFTPDKLVSISIKKIQGDASSRQYFRVTGPENSSIVCYDPAFETTSAGTYPFLILHSLFSRHDVPVPAVVSIDAAKDLLLLEDLRGSAAAEPFRLLDPAYHSRPLQRDHRHTHPHPGNQRAER